MIKNEYILKLFYSYLLNILNKICRVSKNRRIFIVGESNTAWRLLTVGSTRQG